MLPVGIQSFKKIREEGYEYVDKTDIVWDLANDGRQYVYQSRPRRFGKSELVDTLQAYFKGRRDPFEGLKIMELEDEWKQYPIIRLDMSRGLQSGPCRRWSRWPRATHGQPKRHPGFDGSFYIVVPQMQWRNKNYSVMLKA